MATIDAKEAVRALNGWARAQGYSDFDVYVQAGGSVGDALADIEKRIHRLHLARTALYEWRAPPPAPEPQHKPEVVGQGEAEDYERANARMADAALAAAEAEVIGDPVDPDNAHIQGAEL